MNVGWLAIHYLGDFLAVLSKNDGDNMRAYESFFAKTCKTLEFNINGKKNVSDTLAEFFDIEIDTIQMEVRLPQDKLEKAKSWVAKTLKSQTISRSNLRSLLGFLSFACKVVIPGRAFLLRLFDALGEKRHYYTVDLKCRPTCFGGTNFSENGMAYVFYSSIIQENRYVYGLTPLETGAWGGFYLLTMKKCLPCHKYTCNNLAQGNARNKFTPKK